MWLFILFFTVPVIEIVLFIKVGSAIGLIPTVLVILITALAGTFFVKQQASQLFDLFKRKAGNLEDPSEPIGHGVLVLFAGALLLTPGFFTDVFGFLLLVPNFRYWVFRKIEKRFIHIKSFNNETSNQHETIYDADYTDITPNDGSPWNKNKNQKD
tara:strand:+ start:2109 stop:2576 length:468 start_codon:yes stop_codon:yes gene_type:complete